MSRLPSATVGIDAPAARVWEILGPGFDRIGEWASAISHSAPSPSGERSGPDPFERVCISTVRGVPEVRERLIAYDPATMSLTYEAAAGMPSFVRRATNTWTVTPQSDARCSVTAVADVEARGWPGRIGLRLARGQLLRMGTRTLDDLRHFVEHGQPSPRKRRWLARARPTTAGS